LTLINAFSALNFRIVGHSEVILGPNFPVVTWTYSGVLGHVPVGAEFLLFFSVLEIPKISNFRTPDILLKSGQNWGFSRVGCGPKPVRFLSLQL